MGQRTLVHRQLFRECADEITRENNVIIKRKCMKCKQVVEIEGKVETTRNGRKMLRGKCPKCGVAVCQFMPKDTPEG